MKKRSIFLKMVIGCICIVVSCLWNVLSVYADGQFSVSPMNQKIVLVPGETYYGSFKVINPATNENNFLYEAKVSSFYVNDKYGVVYENSGDYNQMVDWVTIENPEGRIAPNSVKELYFSIKVPETAPAGGQYAAITVTSKNDNIPEGNSININAKYSIAHIIYAEIAGTTVRSGEIVETNVPSFVLSGNIVGTSLIKNTGNVHGTARYILQVFPLFSDEEIYTNYENPAELTILPDRARYVETVWENTPAMGIFNVVYTVEFEGVTAEVSKMVIKCPIWLLFIVIFVVVALIIWLVMRAKARRRGAE